jgi:hypothetical protein
MCTPKFYFFLLSDNIFDTLFVFFVEIFGNPVIIHSLWIYFVVILWEFQMIHIFLDFSVGISKFPATSQKDCL